jgi:hypothetical protein
LRTVGDIIAGSGDTVRTDELDEFARANVLRSDRAVKISTFVSMAARSSGRGVGSRLRCDVRTATRDVCFTSTASVRYAIEFDADALNEILRMANAIGNAAAESSAMTQNARGPRAP